MKPKNKNLTLEDYFLISIENLDIANIDDLEHEFFQLEYCENSLDVPIHLIEYTGFDGNELEICLKKINFKDIKDDDDWYFQLKNLSTYTKAS